MTAETMTTSNGAAWSSVQPEPPAPQVRPFPQSTHALPLLPHAFAAVPPRHVEPEQQPWQVALQDVSMQL
jgi:hypothetical protein